MRTNKGNRRVLECATDFLQREQPATLRAVFYACVSAGAIRNAQSEYKRLGRLLTRAREAGVVQRRWIVDNVRSTLKPSSWAGLGVYADVVADCYRRDFWASLPVHVEMFVEKDAVAGTVQPITAKYDVALRVLRGYSSVSFAGEVADLWRNIEKPIIAYYIGDFDPSGFDLERDVREKLGRYSGRKFDWRRLGVVEADFDRFGLLELPVKATDCRAAGFHREHGKRCAEIDALTPTELRGRVERAILSNIDPDQWRRLQEVERLERRSWTEAMAGFRQKPNLGSLSQEGGRR